MMIWFQGFIILSRKLPKKKVVNNRISWIYPLPCPNLIVKCCKIKGVVDAKLVPKFLCNQSITRWPMFFLSPWNQGWILKNSSSWKQKTKNPRFFLEVPFKHLMGKWFLSSYGPYPSRMSQSWGYGKFVEVPNEILSPLNRGHYRDTNPNNALFYREIPKKWPYICSVWLPKNRRPPHRFRDPPYTFGDTQPKELPLYSC